MAVLLLVALPLGLGCKTSRAGQPTYPGGGALVDPKDVPESLRDDWQALVDARVEDRAGQAVEDAADAILDKAPPVELRVGALAAKAERQYLLGADAEALSLADAAIAALEGEGVESKHTEDLQVASHRIAALASVRGGDPARALAELERLEQWGGIDRVELRGARAVALDRSGDREAALVAFVAWRELLDDDSPDAGYAEQRITVLVGGLDRGALEKLVEAAPGPDAADCLRATMGVDPGDQAPRWVANCRPLPTRVGILLPRSGKLAVLAEAQFAAAVAAVTVLGGERPVSVIWRDSGSTTKSARDAARTIVSDGADVIVGPVGASNVKAALSAAGVERFVLPGEAIAQARGVAPTLEARTTALLDEAASRSTAGIVVLVPDNGYGKRARKAVESHSISSSKSLKVLSYSTSTTSFSPVLEAAAPLLKKGAALVVCDALPRTELITRQARRDGFRVEGSDDSEGRPVAVFALGEGLSPERIGPQHASLEGVILAPAAAPDADSRAFEDQYRAQQGVAPDDQALLVWRALSAAWSGAASTLEPEVRLVRVRGSRVVAQ